MDVKCLNIGQSINIRRSDGRVHPAAISGIDTEKCLISVEWFEDNETKGKEIDFATILSTNKGLVKSVPRVKNLENSVPPVASNIAKDSRGPLKRAYHRRTVATPKAKKLPPLPVPPANPQQVLVENDEPDNVSKGVQRERHDQRVVSGAPGRLRGGRIAVVKGLRSGAGTVPEPDEEKEETSDVLQPLQQLGVGTSKDRAVAAAAAAVAKPRKSISVCVKEVEKLKKNREDRRAKQAEQIAQKAEYCDMSHPNWDFYRMMQEFKASIRIKPFLPDEPVLLSKISVCVRKRPLNKKEIARREIDVVTIPEKGSILIHEPKTKVDLTKYLENQSFTFDCSFDESVSNEVVYRHTAKPLVRTVFERGMATCFAYGQTGSGKTHTMGGVFSGKEQDPSKGIYSLAAADIFALNSTPANAKKKLNIYASFFEIYSGKVFDLLNKKEKLRILEDQKQQVQIVGLVEEQVECVQDVLRLIQLGNKSRTSGVTSANQHSSRSHAVFQLIVRTRSNLRLFGKFSLIDLAGNERGADTATSDRLTRMEGAQINKSLLALKECIRALSRKGAHLPFRGSKLTLVLKDSFVGENSRTCMIAMISPGFNSCEHTLNTLRYADRVKELRGGGVGGPASVGDVPSHQQLVQLPGGGEDEDKHSLLENDLQYLHRSLRKDSGGELDMNESSEILIFHEAINNLVDSEEQLVEEHKAIIQADQFLLEEEERLLLYVQDNDHDIEQYVTRIEKIVSQKLERLSSFKERIQDLKQRLREEETASRKVKRLPML